MKSARWLQRSLGLAGVLLLVGLVTLVFRMPLDEQERTGWRMIGRLHPLLVHFPVALLLVVPLLEIAIRWRPGCRDAAGLLLWLGTAGAYAAVVAGLALAYADGHAGTKVERHFWGGVAVAAAATMACLARERGWRLYAASLLGTVGILGWAAHLGGNLVHGSYYLTEGIPASVRRVLRIPDPPQPEVYSSDTVYGAAVYPLLERYCLSCHGSAKQRGGYQMDNFNLLVAGGQSGVAALVPGQPDRSELLRRVLLPVGDKKAMPPQGQRHPKEPDLNLLRWWIVHGASRELSLAQASQQDPSFAAIVRKARPADAEPIYLPRVPDYTKHAEEISQLSHDLGVTITPISKRTGDGLLLRLQNPARTFGNNELGKLKPIAAFIAEMDLGGAQLDDRSVVGLKEFRNLTKLGLARTKLTGESLQELATLSQLSTINLYDSQLSDVGLAKIAAMKQLRKLYTAGSRVTEEGLNQFRAQRPECELP